MLCILILNLKMFVKKKKKKNLYSPASTQLAEQHAELCMGHPLVPQQIAFVLA